jgi:hypothetical protein
LPANCIGGSPDYLIQSCKYVPPACTSFTYSVWSDCNSDGKQSKTIVSSLPANCLGGNPDSLIQSCTYVPPTCTSFSYSSWTDCNLDGKQSKTIISKSPQGCVGGNPDSLIQDCVIPTCVSFLYSDWGDCNSSGKQTKSITAKIPPVCVNGNPEPLIQDCTYTPGCSLSTAKELADNCAIHSTGGALCSKFSFFNAGEVGYGGYFGNDVNYMFFYYGVTSTDSYDITVNVQKSSCVITTTDLQVSEGC